MSIDKRVTGLETHDDVRSRRINAISTKFKFFSKHGKFIVLSTVE